MKYLLLAAAFALAAPVAMAQEKVRVFLSVNNALELSQPMKAAREAQAADTGMAAIKEKQAVIQSFTESLDAARHGMKPDAIARKEKVIADLRIDLANTSTAFNSRREARATEAYVSFGEKWQPAIDSYLALNPSVAAIEFLPRADYDGFVAVRNPAYDITPAIVGIMENGTKKFANVAPKKAAKTAYIDYAKFAEASGIETKWKADLAARMDSGRSTEFEARGLFAQELRAELSVFLKTDASAKGADIVRFHNYPGVGEVLLADKALDITAAAAAAYKGAKGL